MSSNTVEQQRFVPGEVVEVRIKPATVTEVGDRALSVRYDGDDDAQYLVIRLGEAVQVVRAAPPEWPPVGGDMWSDVGGHLWAYRDVPSLGYGEFLSTDEPRQMDAPEFLETRGPLLLVGPSPSRGLPDGIVTFGGAS